MFCDNTRDAIKGHCFYAREAGYVNGRPDMFPEIRAAVTAWCCSDALPEHAPGQIVSYVSAHDNYTLWDKLLLVRTDHPDYNVFDPAVLAENRLAAGIYLTCMGIPVLQCRDLRPLINKRGPSNQRNPAVGVLPAVGFWFYGVTACTAAPSGRPSRRLRIRSGGSRRGPFPACGPGPPVPGQAG